MIVNEPNFYNVDYRRKYHSRWDFREAMMDYDDGSMATCMVMKAKVRILRKRDPPMNKLPLGKFFPKRKLFKMFQEIRSCAIVSSAGSMRNSRLGHFIDLHDIVMRFNNAPVEGFEEDVGTKTTIRVVNSQVVSKAEFNFVNSPIFQNITIAAWDPGKYNVTLKDWLENADFNLFVNYEKFRKRYPKSNAYLIDPQSIWKLWDQLQGFTRTPIRCNPPSSGFIGLALLLPHCPYVDFIEYVPSTRLNGRCHYYSDEINSACTFGAWHPLAAEKLMTLKMNVADDYATFQNGIIRIRRPEPKSCS
ncbi:unnamed protein product [Hermetia illucens]|uniref:Beta-galactoside alpha-2,6-sialyltransferase 1 n=2 Tax=Hermetia illucens TaxID=343691 RepID=A0A7R8UC02_HERIL|nr:unnamed protein product [Hermetia illucens]